MRNTAFAEEEFGKIGAVLAPGRVMRAVVIKRYLDQIATVVAMVVSSL
jgi:hypothetical protein